MVVGLTLAAIALFLRTRIDVDTGYGLLLPAFVLMGIGMALVMSPMSTAAMNAVPPQKAGVASGIVSMSRMVLPPVAAEAAHNAFIHALASGMWLSASVAAVGALLALWLIGGKPAPQPAVSEAAGVPAAEDPYSATRPCAAAATAEAVPVAR